MHSHLFLLVHLNFTSSQLLVHPNSATQIFSSSSSTPMVICSKPALDDCKPTTFDSGIPVIDISKPNAGTLVVKACEEFGFFKVINHGVPMEFISKLESEAMKFFSLPKPEKEKNGLASPLGYGIRRIGPNGDIGWIEYILLRSNPEFVSQQSLSIFGESPEKFRSSVNAYISAVKTMACEILEVMADGLGIEQRNVFSKLMTKEESDCLFRINHYPPCPDVPTDSQDIIGFGEHTDPQMISVLHSNNTSGFEIHLQDGTWVPVPPDQNSFFINVGDLLQVMTNGRFKSVRHRVLANGSKARLSMIFLGGPCSDQKMTPLPFLIKEGEESLYKEFTWHEYKELAYKLRLADKRLQHFEKLKTPIANGLNLDD